MKSGRIKFTPVVDESRVDQVSVDLKLGYKFTILKKPPDYISAVRVDKSIWAADDLWEDLEQERFVLKPQGFVLAQTLERVTLPGDLAGLVEGRSSWGRLGITVHVTAPKIDPGYDNHITLEMCNFGQATVELVAEEDMPAQLMFLQVSQPLGKDEQYGRKESDIFQRHASPRPRLKAPRKRNNT